MNTLLNLLSAAAVVATGAFASTAPRDTVAQPTAQPFSLSAKVSSPRMALQSPVFEANGQWLTISEGRGVEADDLQAAPTQRWIF
ncbi:MAG: hypothetical protein V4812_09620 [Pseudomonadota bacterium]